MFCCNNNNNFYCCSDMFFNGPIQGNYPYIRPLTRVTGSTGPVGPRGHVELQDQQVKPVLLEQPGQLVRPARRDQLV